MARRWLSERLSKLRYDVMKIVGLETIHSPRFSNLVWVRISTDEGITGLGETFRNPGPVIAYIHETCAPYLLGRDPRPVALHADALLHRVGNHFQGYPTRSVEIRGNSAVDMALWDIKAQAAGLSVTELLGGPVRASIPIYNTCAGPAYNTKADSSARARLVRAGDPAMLEGDTPDDLAAQINAPGELAQSLLAEGITAMKIWPFDEAALETGGQRITAARLSEALARIAAIRDAVGDQIDIMLEYHAYWKFAPAKRILAEVDAYKPFWHEDPISMTEIADLAELRRMSGAPFAGSETHGTATWFRDALALRAVDYLHFDMGWVGGLSEGLRIAHLAASHDRMIAPHDCTGPVTWIANLHLALSQPNALILESVRAYYRGFYRELVTDLPVIEHGVAQALPGIGLGTQLAPQLLDDPTTQLRRTSMI